MRTFVLGDIHGAYKALRQVAELSGFDYERDRLIQLGDVADGWPETAECVEELLKVKNLIAIRGNHDAWCLEWLRDGCTDEYWPEFGGRATMHSYLNRKKSMLDKHVQFFERQVNYYIDDQQRLFVHAGYNVNEPIVIQSDYTFHFSRDYWNLMRKHAEEFREKPEDINGFSEVFIGHTQTPKYAGHSLPVNYLHCWNLDQGCKGGYKLTMMNVDTKEFVQSDDLILLYPEGI